MSPGLCFLGTRKEPAHCTPSLPFWGILRPPFPTTTAPPHLFHLPFIPEFLSLLIRSLGTVGRTEGEEGECFLF